MAKKHVQKIEKAWGVLYPAQYEQFYYLRKRKVTFRRSSIGKLSPFKTNVMDHIFSSLTDQALFNIEKQIEGNDILIVVKRKSEKAVLANGEEIYEVKTVVDGHCDIVVPEYSLHFVFEAFVDVSADKTIEGIGKNYRIINQIGRGGFGVVYKGFKADDQTFCAIKTEQKTGKARLSEEFGILRKIHHPNIILCLDFIEHVGYKYLVTELAHGGSLRNKLDREGWLPERQSKHIYRQMFSGLAHLHSLDIIHRDIKPLNIVLMSVDEFCIAKLIDFGVSCFLFEKNERLRATGTIKYMSPEMLRNVAVSRYDEKRYDEKVDIWGMGITVFFTLTGKAPFLFDGDPIPYRNTILRQEMRTHLPSYQQLSETAKIFISKCLQISKAERSSATELLDDVWLST